jgi:hypothetical protein
MARVYVSSTFADLRRERQAVMDWLVAAGHQPVHSYRPNSETVRESCLDDVDTCDLYVLIAGHRYGFRPADGNPEGLSITQLEFRRAGQAGIPRIALVRTSMAEVGTSDIGDPRRLALVLAFREEVAREVRAAEFGEVEGLILGLSTGVQAELDKLGKRSPADWGVGHRAAGPVLRLAPRPAFLAGREELLAELDARLAGREGASLRVVALSGLGGAGKTSVAVEYAHRHLAEVGLTWQFAAEDPAVLKAEFGELAAQLGARDLFDARDPVALVHGALAAYPRGWLLVFDNAADPASVNAFLPPAGPGRVLITSRDPFWPPDQALEVPVLDSEVAADFLINRTGDAAFQEARELAVELGGLPLALEQAGAYMRAAGRGIGEYLGLFRARRPELLGRGDPAGYDKRVTTTWALAFAELGQEGPAAGLLRLAACCAAEDIPMSLLLRPRPGLAEGFAEEVAPLLVPLLEDDLARDDAVAGLRRYSLISEPRDGLISVHRLVQAITLAQLPAGVAAAWRQATAALVGAALPADPPWLPGTWPGYAMLLPHVQAAAPANSAAAAAIADYLGFSGSYSAARASMERVLEAREHTYGPEHPDTLKARGGLAHWAAQAGDPAAARDQLAGLVPVAERVLGPERPDTLWFRRELAWWTGEAGDAAAARDQYAALVPVCERVLGPEHSETLTVRQGLAAFTGRAGDAAAARDQSAALVPVYERVLGPEHSGTLGAQANLAGWTGAAGDPAAAQDLIAKVTAVRARVFGPEHPETLTTRRHVATWTGEAGDPAAAHDQMAELLPIYERVLGHEHPDTLVTRDEFADLTGEAGDPAAARDLFAALLPVRERVLGQAHPHTLLTQHSLARWTGEAGDPAAARNLLAELGPVEERVLGPEHPDTLLTRHSLALWTGEAGDPAAARDHFAELVPVEERVLGPEHPHTLDARRSLARWTGEAGDPAAARDLLAGLLPARERVSGPRHPDTLATRAELARWTERADGSPSTA